MAGGNPQFYLGAGIDFAPHCQLTSGKCRAFPHSAQPIAYDVNVLRFEQAQKSQAWQGRIAAQLMYSS